mgnify:CR=1 FL=1
MIRKVLFFVNKAFTLTERKNILKKTLEIWKFVCDYMSIKCFIGDKFFVIVTEELTIIYIGG